MRSSQYCVGEYENRPWGSWHVVDVGEGYAVKRIVIKPGKRLSLQLHNFRSELWNVVYGSGVVTVGGDEFPVQRGSSIYIPRETRHRLFNHGTDVLQLIEVQYGSKITENDIVRIEDDFGRN
ncbi:MAG: cupin domain-containing protein [Gammaproteobacteria bacterium]|nr:cupin domain-containing protein [Gammaproteobacteria bacterium]